MSLRFTLGDFTAQYADMCAKYDVLLAGQPDGVSFTGGMHIRFVVEGGRTKIRGVPVQNAPGPVGGSGYWAMWGPVQAELRSQGYSDPYTEGSIVIEEDGSYGTWVTEKGFVEGPGLKPVHHDDHTLTEEEFGAKSFHDLLAGELRQGKHPWWPAAADKPFTYLEYLGSRKVA